MQYPTYFSSLGFVPAITQDVYTGLLTGYVFDNIIVKDQGT